MCTVTAVPLANGHRVVCNRDERDARPAAIGPRRHEIDGRVASFPVDPQGMGTWLATNDAGLTLAVLNRTDTNLAVPMRRPLRSRGQIIPSLIGSGRLTSAIEAACAIHVASFDLFRLVAIQGADAAVLTSDGARLTVERLIFSTPLMFTSSSLGDALVKGPRRRLFERTVLKSRDGWIRGQVRFHNHQWPDRPELSVLMRRQGARTVSRSVVDATPDGFSFHYTPFDHASEAP